MALRVCGDWSEHISTSSQTMGKKYYYNSKTEESTWTKPKDWVDESANRPRTSTANDKSYTSNKSADVSNSTSNEHRTLFDKHLLKNSEFDAGSGKPDKQFLLKKFQDSQIEANAYRTSQPSTSHRSYTDHSKTDHRRDHYDSYKERHRRRRDSEGNRSYGHRTPKKHEHHDDMDISPSSTPTSSRQSSCAGTPHIGPPSTPASITTPGSLSIAMSAINSRTPSTSAPLISALPQLITQLSGGQNNQDLTNKALQTLHQLQEVIKRQIAQQQTTGPECQTPVTTTHQQPVMRNAHPSHTSITSTQQQSTSRIPAHQTVSNPNIQMAPVVQNQGSIYGRVVSQHPAHPMNGRVHAQQPSPNLRLVTQHHHLPHADIPNEIGDSNHMTSQHTDPEFSQDATGGGGSPGSETSRRSSCMSPNSTTSSQNACVEAGPLTNMGVTKDPATDMMNSLKQYYNEKLVTHVSGWQAEHAERQANRYWEEGLKIGSFHCSQVSVNLKRARSLVRLAEIQSTLHEQRILFLNQQVHQLESMKPPSFTSSQPFSSSS